MKNDLAKFCTRCVLIERAIFVGPDSESVTVSKALCRDGWHLTRAGPYTDRTMYPTMDPERFLFHAEREVDPPAPTPAPPR